MEEKDEREKMPFLSSSFLDSLHAAMPNDQEHGCPCLLEKDALVSSVWKFRLFLLATNFFGFSPTLEYTCFLFGKETFPMKIVFALEYLTLQK